MHQRKSGRRDRTTRSDAASAAGTRSIRSDIREDRHAIPLTLTITVVDANAGCAPVPRADVEIVAPSGWSSSAIWHAGASGNYSEYATERAKASLRGVQTTDANGQVVFTTMYPGCDPGRAAHIQVEVKTNGVSRRVTQMALADARGWNLHRHSLASELVTPAGSPASGYTATFQVAINRRT